MNTVRLINSLWLALIALTLFTAYMAEQDEQGASSIAILALVLAIKGRIIVDYFMELKDADVVLKTLMRVYFYVIPLLVVVVYLFPETIARWTAL